MIRTAATPLSMFISYASVPKDEALLANFEAHLSVLEEQGLITFWHRRKLLAGMDTEQESDRHLESASLILLLLSADYSSSDLCRKEMQRALARHENGITIVVPIFLRPVHHQGMPFKHLLCLPRDERPVTSWGNNDEAFTAIVTEIRALVEHASPSQGKSMSEKERRLKACLVDDRDFVREHLDHFVGRQQELAEIEKHIKQCVPMGGYVIITGQAGQGKSSIIAKLVEKYGGDQVPYHFIPLNPGPDHQVTLLRNVMTRLILKYDLSDFYIASDNRAALRAYLPHVLTEVVEKESQEVFFLDGLDQLEEDSNGRLDLSFLPKKLPRGIVFVLGTRPNGVMKSLALLQSYVSYQLPLLSRRDFIGLLANQQVTVEQYRADQLYQAMEGNALYLALVARELQTSDTLDLSTLIARVTARPDAIFSLAIERLKRQSRLWDKVIYRVLGILFVTQEALSLSSLNDILQVKHDKLKDGLTRLGGLVVTDAQQRYSLFHLKFRDYLRYDEEDPQRESLFSKEEEKGWHAQLVTWCERTPLSAIWQDTQHASTEQGRRMYARQHYVTHLYAAQNWQKLFKVLDEGSYGQAKERFYLSARGYAQDLDRGRQAAAHGGATLEEMIALLPRLWYYTLLRGCLKSRADSYPQATFRLLLLLNREAEVLGLAELFTDQFHTVEVLLLIAEYIALLPGREAEGTLLLRRVEEIIRTLEENTQRSRALSKLALVLVKMKQWERAREVLSEIEEKYHRLLVLEVLVEAKQWEPMEELRTEALQLLMMKEGGYERVLHLSKLVVVFEKGGQWDLARELWAKFEEMARASEKSDEKAHLLSVLAVELIRAKQWSRAEAIVREIKGSKQEDWVLSTLTQAFISVEQWDDAERVARKIGEGYWRVMALGSLAVAFTEAGQVEPATSLWTEMEEIADREESNSERASILKEIVVAFAKGRLWDRAENVARTIRHRSWRIEALSELARELVVNQQKKRAEAICNEVERLLRLSGDEVEKVEALGKLAVACIKVEQWALAEELWAVAEEVIKGIGDSEERNLALSALAMQLMQVEQWDGAELLARSIEIEHFHHQSFTLYMLARALGKARLWDRAEMVVRSIENSNMRNTALSELSVVLENAEQWEQARTLQTNVKVANQAIEKRGESGSVTLSDLVGLLILLERWEYAIEIARIIEDSFEKARVLSGLAIALTQAEQWELAKKLWVEVEEVAQKEDIKRVWILEGLANALTVAGEYPRLLALIHSSWLQVETRKDAFLLFPFVLTLLFFRKEMSLELYSGFTRVNTFLSE